jgi:hypothetical protein
MSLPGDESPLLAVAWRGKNGAHSGLLLSTQGQDPSAVGEADNGRPFNRTLGGRGAIAVATATLSSGLIQEPATLTPQCSRGRRCPRADAPLSGFRNPLRQILPGLEGTSASKKGDCRAKKGYRPGATILARFDLAGKNRAHSRLKKDERLLGLGSLGAASTAAS